MRLRTFLLLPLLALSLAARADPIIDNFVIVGDGHTLTFSLDSILPPGGFMGAAQYKANASATGMIDGVGGYNFTLVFSAILDGSRHPISGGLDISSAGLFDYNLAGTPSLINGSGPGFSGAYLVPGNYTLSKIPASSTPDLFSVSITPESAASPVPEPRSLAFLLTGISALLLIPQMHRSLLSRP